MSQQSLLDETAAPLVPPRLDAEEARGCRRRVQGLPALEDRHADRVRRRLGEGPGGVRRRAAGRPGGQGGRARRSSGLRGRFFDQALKEAGIDRSLAYVTNVVKHFKWKAQGKRRIHQKPNSSEIAACRPWLDAELAVVQPHVLACLGATAAQALLGRTFRVTQQRGRPVESALAPVVMATVHPSSILRAGENRDAELAAFIDDLRAVAEQIAAHRFS
jgi:DNA polymerase